MGWLSMIPGLFGPAKELVEVFKPNAENEAERGHSERLALSAQDLASLQQFATEFQRNRARPRRCRSTVGAGCPADGPPR